MVFIDRRALPGRCRHQSRLHPDRRRGSSRALSPVALVFLRGWHTVCRRARDCRVDRWWRRISGFLYTRGNFPWLGIRGVSQGAPGRKVLMGQTTKMGQGT